MKLLRVGGDEKTVSLEGVISMAFRSWVSSSKPARVSCVAGMVCNKAGEPEFCPGKLVFTANAASPSATHPKPTKRRTGNASALRRRCALMGGSICFFMYLGKPSVACTSAPTSLGTSLRFYLMPSTRFKENFRAGKLTRSPQRSRRKEVWSADHADLHRFKKRSRNAQ